MPIQKLIYPDINGNRYSFASIEAVFNGLLFAGFSSIDYAHMLEPSDVYGAASPKIGRTRGKQTETLSFSMYREEFENLRITLGAGGIGYMEQPFDINVVYFEIEQVPILDILRGVRITGATQAHSADSSDALKVDVACNVMRVYLGSSGSPGLPRLPILA